MARFTNFATLSYQGGTTESNTVTGELVETLTLTKTALVQSYEMRDRVTYVLSIVNSGTTAFSGLTVSDDLGGYLFDTQTLYPLRYVEDSLSYYVNGVLQAKPTVNAGPPLSIGGLQIPAGGNAMLVYEADTTDNAPLGTDASITNTATLSGNGVTSELSAEETITMESRVNLSISKALCPTTVSENGRLTYTFVIENSGATEAVATDQVVLTDTFDPILSSLVVTFNDTTWTEGVNYLYNATTGVFSTISGQITVPAAEYSQNSDGSWSVTPGVATLTISGTV